MSKSNWSDYTEPKSAETKVNERMLLGGMIKHREIYHIMSVMGLRDWFWGDNTCRQIYRAVSDVIECRGYQCLLATVNSGGYDPLRRGIDRLMSSHDCDFYKRDLDELGEMPLINLIGQHVHDRKIDEWNTISQSMKLALVNSEDISPFQEKISSLLCTGQKRQNLTTRDILGRITHTEPERAITTQIYPLDKHVRIGEGGQLVILGGESSSGKTTLANQIVTSVCEQKQGKVRYYSTETSEERLGWRFLKHIQFVNQCTWQQAEHTFGSFEEDLFITSQIREIDEITEDIRERHAKGDGLKVVVVDYLQNLQVRGCYNNTEIAERCIMRFHELAQELRLVMVVLCQLTKEGSGIDRATQKPVAPTMNSFRGAAQIGNSADVCIINQFNKRVDTLEHGAPRDIDFHVVKNKEGYQCVLKMSFIGSGFTFIEREIEA